MLFIVASVLLFGCGSETAEGPDTPGDTPQTQAKPQPAAPSDAGQPGLSGAEPEPDADVDAELQPTATAVSFFKDGMGKWETIQFGGEGTVFLKDGELNLDMGGPLTGVQYKGDLEDVFGKGLDNYTISLMAQRKEGIDMFLGLTFPVGKDGHVSLVLGGWAGAITGISNLDGLNASENSTTKYFGFKDKHWYAVKVRVTPEKIEAWLDDEQIVDEGRADYTEFDTHGAVVDTKPFGLFTYGTWGAYKDFKVTRLE